MQKLPRGLYNLVIDEKSYVVTSRQIGEIEAIISECSKDDPNARKLHLYKASNHA